MNKVVIVGAGVAVGWLILQLKDAQGTGNAIGAGAVDLVDGVVSGATYGIGERIGLPDTRQASVVEQGRAELAAGNYWDASFHLPAGEFISGSWRRIFN